MVERHYDTVSNVVEQNRDGKDKVSRRSVAGKELLKKIFVQYQVHISIMIEC